jgi:hypothetical protein
MHANKEREHYRSTKPNLRGLLVHRAGDRDRRAELVFGGLRGELQYDLQQLRLREGFQLFAQPLVELELVLMVVLLVVLVLVLRLMWLMRLMRLVW